MLVNNNKIAKSLLSQVVQRSICSPIMQFEISAKKVPKEVLALQKSIAAHFFFKPNDKKYSKEIINSLRILQN